MPGFTLIEVMLVLTLIVILSSVTMPSLRGFAGSTRLKSSASAIRDMLHFARDVAITEGSAYLVVFDLDQNRYWLASSETFVASDLASSLVANTSNTINQSEMQRSESSQPVISRTSMILGIPRQPNHNIILSQMVTNRNSRSMNVDDGIDYIYFSPTGSSEDIILYIQDQVGRVVSIEVEAASARVRIQDVAAEENGAYGMHRAGNNRTY
ncbi:MAG: prepilin-type N-terminal cleavage/methylation domain-containing protein [Candidatus Poribacteria bacterium]|nr:prepilin-type N-terminal cleavage/methylation domain-containing protein [Candidatus Poribacteria bacterium]